MSYDELSDDTPFVVDQKPAASSVAIRDNINRVETALSEIDKVNAGLEDLARRFPVDLVYDVSTGRGMVEAIAHRAAWREPRLSVERLRKQGKAPVLALGKDIDARAAWLTEQLLIGEIPIDQQIKAEEARKEAEKQAKVNAEFARVQAIQDALGEIHMGVMALTGKPSATIAAALEGIRTAVLDPMVFQEQIAQAKTAQSAAISKAELMLSAALHHEAEAAKMAAERAELEELRKMAAAQKAKDAEANAIALKKEAEELAAARIAIEVERKDAREFIEKEQEEARKARDEAARVAQQARDEREKVEAAERKARMELEAADHRMRDAAPIMLAALRLLRELSVKAAAIADPAIKDAT